MECYIKFQPIVIKALAQVSLTKSIGQIGMINLFFAQCDQITFTSVSA